MEVKQQENKIESAWKVEMNNLKFLSIESSGKEAVKDFGENTERLEKFLRVLEKKFHEIIWYIGSDIFDDKVYERFMFNKSGFMEVVLSKTTDLHAYFSDKKKAEKFISALKQTFSKLGIRGGENKLYKV